MSNDNQKQINLFGSDPSQAKACIEGILFISEKPVKIGEISRSLDMEPKKVENIILELRQEYEDSNRGFIIRKVSGGYRFYSNPSISEHIKEFVSSNIRYYLSQAALETLAIVAYKQPITRTQVAEIRGIRTDSVIITLVEKGLLKETGRLKEPGNPIIYQTTDKFLELLGISSIGQLPPLQDNEDEQD